MGKIRRARQKLHLPAVKPDNEKDKQDVMKPNEVCQTRPLLVLLPVSMITR